MYGRVTELCKVSQRKYNLAVAVLMGKNIDSVVVDTERTAKDCIQYLKEQGVPPMTFIPIQTVKVREHQTCCGQVIRVRYLPPSSPT